ncbi:MAG: hypothetical protein QME78_04755 [Thermodesulfobacteriota bacterium]|nr:hypothetical protein [Thermodesulfobacteriota bacterium]
MGSPSNMGRIAHEFYEGEIKKISIGLTSDLFARRAINASGILSMNRGGERIKLVDVQPSRAKAVEAADK